MHPVKAVVQVRVKVLVPDKVADKVPDRDVAQVKEWGVAPDRRKVLVKDKAAAREMDQVMDPATVAAETNDRIKANVWKRNPRNQ